MNRSEAQLLRQDGPEIWRQPSDAEASVTPRGVARALCRWGRRASDISRISRRFGGGSQWTIRVCHTGLDETSVAAFSDGKSYLLTYNVASESHGPLIRSGLGATSKDESQVFSAMVEAIFRHRQHFRY